jgi:16S rRNA (cytosine967-C5)-methyltransferase
MLLARYYLLKIKIRSKFLTTDIGKEFNFVKDQKILASESGFDGFYMAL